MSASKVRKQISFILLLGLIIIVVIIFGKIRNSNDLSDSFPYVLLILQLVLIIALFVIAVIGKSKNQQLEELSKVSFKIQEEITASDKSNDIEDKQEDIDSDYYINKLVPKVSSKMTLEKYTEKFLSNLAKEFDIVQGLFFTREKGTDEFSIKGKYAYFGDTDPVNFSIGQTIPGQVAQNQRLLTMDEIPDGYLTILSGLGNSAPSNLIFVPVLFEENTVGIVELASFNAFEKRTQNIFKIIADVLGQNLNKF